MKGTNDILWMAKVTTSCLENELLSVHFFEYATPFSRIRIAWKVKTQDVE